MPRLSVNVDHIASLRQARAVGIPDPMQAAVMVELAGADGITIHLRQDRRHITDRDAALIKQIVHANLTVEMSPTQEMVDIALKLKPDMVTLVPERAEELTTERGFTLADEGTSLESVIYTISQAEIAVSLFIEPTERDVKQAAEMGADFVELNTSHYADAKSFDDELSALRAIERAAHIAAKQELGIAVGHGLNYKNVSNIAAIESVEEFSIGFAIVARSVFVGLTQAVAEMITAIKEGKARLRR